MKNKCLSRLAAAFGLGLLFLSVCPGALLQAQEPDPFYMDLYTKGERAFLARDYSEAAKKLEIAAFGLYGQKELMEKAHAYLAIAHYHLKNMERCEKFLKDARDLLGEEGFNGLEIDESAWPDMEMLVSRFKMGRIPKREQRLIEQGTVEELEARIQKDPHSAAYYYALYERHRQQNDSKAARETIKDMLVKIPAEINGYLMLAKMDYQVQEFKDAAKNLDKILKLSENAEIDESLLQETRAYAILCASLRGDRKKTQRLVSKWSDALSDEQINSLSLGEEDKEKLRGILEAQERQAEAVEEKLQQKRLEAAVKREPKNIALYYELYEFHRKSNDSKAAKKVIKDMVKKNPAEMEGRFLLGKIEFSQRRYKDALKAFNPILETSSEVGVSRELRLKSTIYAVVCLSHLKREKDVRTFLDFLWMSAGEEEVERLVKAEGLESEWRSIR